MIDNEEQMLSQKGDRLKCFAFDGKSESTLYNQGDYELHHVASILNFQRQFAAVKENNITDFSGHLLGKKDKENLLLDNDEPDIEDDEDAASGNICSPIESICLLERKSDRAKVQIPTLNEVQEKAANEFLSSTKKGISIVQGPPGTG